MTNEEFIALVAKMRSLQKQYFKTRDRSTLEKSKSVEIQVDAAIAELTQTAKQTLLF
jgi:hypothetical protein